MEKVSASDRTAARKAGKLPKEPKKPKRGASLAQLESFLSRHAAWAKRVKDMAAAARKREALQKKIFR